MLWLFLTVVFLIMLIGATWLTGSLQYQSFDIFIVGLAALFATVVFALIRMNLWLFRRLASDYPVRMMYVFILSFGAFVVVVIMIQALLGQLGQSNPMTEFAALAGATVVTVLVARRISSNQAQEPES